MLVWNPVTEEAKWEVFASTRYASGPSMGSHVDATPDTLSSLRYMGRAGRYVVPGEAVERLPSTSSIREFPEPVGPFRPCSGPIVVIVSKDFR